LKLINFPPEMKNKGEILATILKDFDYCFIFLHNTLSPEHVLGYFNIRTSEFIKNRNWNPRFNSCDFKSTGKKYFNNVNH